MDHLCAGDLIVGRPLHPSAQGFDSFLGGFQFLIGLHGLHGQEVSARLHQWQAQLTQYAEIRHGPARRHEHDQRQGS